MDTKIPADMTAIYNVYHQNGTDYVTMEWKGYANSAQFREGTERMLMELQKHRVHKVLGNIKDMVLIGIDDQAWLHGDFLPRAIAAGFKAIALVRPLNYFNNVAIESIAYKVQSESLQIRMFNELAEAEEWLSACGTSESV